MQSDFIFELDGGNDHRMLQQQICVLFYIRQKMAETSFFWQHNYVDFVNNAIVGHQVALDDIGIVYRYLAVIRGQRQHVAL